jgi:hypothetical protein
MPSLSGYEWLQPKSFQAGLEKCKQNPTLTGLKTSAQGYCVINEVPYQRCSIACSHAPATVKIRAQVERNVILGIVQVLALFLLDLIWRSNLQKKREGTRSDSVLRKRRIRPEHKQRRLAAWKGFQEYLAAIGESPPQQQLLGVGLDQHAARIGHNASAACDGERGARIPAHRDAADAARERSFAQFDEIRFEANEDDPVGGEP